MVIFHSYVNVYQRVASGKHRTNYGNSPFFMGKSTMNGHVQ